MKLKPCPFCGGEAAFSAKSGDRYPWKAGCLSCEIYTQGSSSRNDDYNAKKWNARALPVGAIRKALVLLENAISKLFDEQADPYFTDEYRNAAENLAYEKEKIAEQLRALLEGE